MAFKLQSPQTKKTRQQLLASQSVAMVRKTYGVDFTPFLPKAKMKNGKQVSYSTTIFS